MRLASKSAFASGPAAARGATATLLAVLLLTACAGGSAPIRYHVLAPVPPAAGAAYPRYAGSPVVVRGLQLPPGADRTEMTRPLADGTFEVRESDRWAAPLGRLVRQALVEDLALRLPPRSVVVPGAEWPAPRLEVSVDVLSYRVADGAATLALSWGLRAVGKDGGAAVADPASAPRIALRLQTAAAAEGGDAAAWSALMGQLADRVAAAVAGGGEPATRP